MLQGEKRWYRKLCGDAESRYYWQMFCIICALSKFDTLSVLKPNCFSPTCWPFFWSYLNIFFVPFFNIRVFLFKKRKCEETKFSCDKTLFFVKTKKSMYWPMRLEARETAWQQKSHKKTAFKKEMWFSQYFDSYKKKCPRYAFRNQIEPWLRLKKVFWKTVIIYIKM